MHADRTKLAAACKDALIAGARLQRAGTRQQLRAAARRFVRRHRRDSGYLRWVLRAVGASSALSVALLGLGVEPVAAKIAPFGVASPILEGDPGSYTAPALGDLDGDGDLDAVVGVYPGGNFLYYENNGDLFPRTGAANPLNAFDVGIWSIPSLADLDADGDLDLLSGESSGVFFYFENTGNARVPAFVARTGTANPLNGVDVGIDSFPTFGDLDADGDLDLFVGAYDGSFRYFQNTGTPKLPAFVARTGAANPLNGLDIGQVATPSLGDLDADGDLDVLTGEAAYGTFVVFQNRGNAKVPDFGTLVPNLDPVAGISVGTLSTTALGDLDLDGDLDLLAGSREGPVTTVVSHDGDLAHWVVDGGHNPLIFSDVGFRSAPALGDLDADGDLDVVSGDTVGNFHYFQNTGSRTAPQVVERTGSANPLGAFNIGAGSVPFLVDFDSDGDLDAFVGNASGLVFYLANIGTPSTPVFQVSNNPLEGVDFGSDAKIAFGDLDADGDLDFVTGNRAGELRYFETIAPDFISEITGLENPLLDAGFFLYTYLAPALADIDGDGDLDFVSGNQLGGFRYLENVGSATDAEFAEPAPLGPTAYASVDTGLSTPAFGDLDGDGDLDLVSGAQDGYFSFFENFVPRPRISAPLTGVANPLAGQDVGALSAPALADLDRDGDVDLLAGENGGTFRYFENTGSVLTPGFVPRTGAANPLNGRDVGNESKPTFADLDGDGDFDLLSGRLAGDFSYFQNTGNARTPAFAAPLANPFGLSLLGASSAPVFGDFDFDGDLDLTVGSYYDALRWYENTGTRNAPAFVLRSGSVDPFDDLDPDYYATPALADFDSDGDLDLVHGREHGRFAWFENFQFFSSIGAQTRFLPLSDALNPLDGEDVGERAAPAAADLNGDGMPDLVTGALDGTFAVHYLPEPEQGAALGAGFALLKWFERQRRRRGAGH